MSIEARMSDIKALAGEISAEVCHAEGQRTTGDLKRKDLESIHAQLSQLGEKVSDLHDTLGLVLDIAIREKV